MAINAWARGSTERSCRWGWRRNRRRVHAKIGSWETPLKKRIKLLHASTVDFDEHAVEVIIYDYSKWGGPTILRT